MRIKAVLVIVMLLLTFVGNAQEKTKIAAKHTPITYIEKYDSISIALMEEYKIPTSIILGISMWESGYGTSKLSTTKHNYFGIKKNGVYRSYESDTASFKDFCSYISNRKAYQYNYLITNNILDYNVWLIKIQQGGYSESTNWKSKITYMIQKYKLYEYDNPRVDPQIIPD
jgi:flagellum-specific peptidoglycan hydrolase FlgJ